MEKMQLYHVTSYIDHKLKYHGHNSLSPNYYFVSCSTTVSFSHRDCYLSPWIATSTVYTLGLILTFTCSRSSLEMQPPLERNRVFCLSTIWVHHHCSLQQVCPSLQAFWDQSIRPSSVTLMYFYCWTRASEEHALFWSRIFFKTFMKCNCEY